ncbi:biotin-independent malonate decarboxylase subunit gamma [Methylobacterium sp. J-070]|uniref:biotin-independent malonate decarboxylase subunit gamma n=1 Tax=Methylobacterium sp. J-070 TaxID=2836650 RepID=UPI001FB9C9D0|nr:biotin-independent malonate decarboxylase subunit gamma [Methylobacterium sp. J-070]MCJ2051566.1 biotin-independent malonate decarboxylase subunit gamma [Methylobacterium sp. J-070]
MTLAEILASLFPSGHAVAVQDGLVTGSGPFEGGTMHVVGIDGDTPLGVEGAATLSRAVLDAVRTGDRAPILVAVDSDSQRMSRRDELLGLNECLAHLAKTLLLADRSGHPTIGLIYGHSAAGAFIATALATRVLVALPGAEPSVMDLPSVARVTKLPLDKLQEMAKTTPVFAPGLDNMVATGAVHVVLDPARPLAGQIRDVIDGMQPGDVRDRLGAERGGRPVARAVAAAVIDQARLG